VSTTTYTTVNGVILSQATDGVVHPRPPGPEEHACSHPGASASAFSAAVGLSQQSSFSLNSNASQEVGPGLPWPDPLKGLDGLPNFGNSCGRRTGSPKGIIAKECVDAACRVHGYCRQGVEKMEPKQDWCKSKDCNERLALQAVFCALSGCKQMPNCVATGGLNVACYGVYAPAAFPYSKCRCAGPLPQAPYPLPPNGVFPPGNCVKVGWGREICG
jgi:hypothetical protein